MITNENQHTVALSLKQGLIKYLSLMNEMIDKIAPEIFDRKLAEDMLSLGAHAIVVVNFARRIYLPLVEGQGNIAQSVCVGIVNFESSEDKRVITEQIKLRIEQLTQLPDITVISETEMIKDVAGFNDIELPQHAYIHQFALPNFYFHLSMVYAIAKANGVGLSKGDFDGIHQYPPGFSF